MSEDLVTMAERDAVCEGGAAGRTRGLEVLDVGLVYCEDKVHCSTEREREVADVSDSCVFVPVLKTFRQCCDNQ